MIQVIVVKKLTVAVFTRFRQKHFRQAFKNNHGLVPPIVAPIRVQ